MESKRRHVLVSLAALFLLPLVAAVALISHPEWVPESHSNHGQLITPPLTTSFKGGWTLVVPQGRSCDGGCQRLRWVASVVRYALKPESRNATTLAACDAAARKACGAVAGKLGGGPVLVIVDPDGRAVLRYGVEAAPRDVLQDLEALLKVADYWRNHADG